MCAYAFDGYLSGCPVFLDLDGDRLYSADEPLTRSASDGSFSIDDSLIPSGLDLSSVSLVILPDSQCVDVSSRAVQTVRFVAGAQSQVIHPITTLIASVETTSSNSARLILSALLLGNIEGIIDTYDPYFALTAGSQSEVKQASLVMARLLQVNVLVSQLAAFVSIGIATTSLTSSSSLTTVEAIGNKIFELVAVKLLAMSESTVTNANLTSSLTDESTTTSVIDFFISSSSNSNSSGLSDAEFALASEVLQTRRGLQARALTTLLASLDNIAAAGDVTTQSPSDFVAAFNQVAELSQTAFIAFSNTNGDLSAALSALQLQALLDSVDAIVAQINSIAVVLAAPSPSPPPSPQVAGPSSFTIDSANAAVTVTPTPTLAALAPRLVIALSIVGIVLFACCCCLVLVLRRKRRLVKTTPEPLALSDLPTAAAASTTAAPAASRQGRLSDRGARVGPQSRYAVPPPPEGEASPRSATSSPRIEAALGRSAASAEALAASDAEAAGGSQLPSEPEPAVGSRGASVRVEPEEAALLDSARARESPHLDSGSSDEESGSSAEDEGASGSEPNENESEASELDGDGVPGEGQSGSEPALADAGRARSRGSGQWGDWRHTRVTDPGQQRLQRAPNTVTVRVPMRPPMSIGAASGAAAFSPAAVALPSAYHSTAYRPAAVPALPLAGVRPDSASQRARSQYDRVLPSSSAGAGARGGLDRGPACAPFIRPGVRVHEVTAVVRGAASELQPPREGALTRPGANTVRVGSCSPVPLLPRQASGGRSSPLAQAAARANDSPGPGPRPAVRASSDPERFELQTARSEFAFPQAQPEPGKGARRATQAAGASSDGESLPAMIQVPWTGSTSSPVRVRVPMVGSPAVGLGVRPSAITPVGSQSFTLPQLNVQPSDRALRVQSAVQRAAVQAARSTSSGDAEAARQPIRVRSARSERQDGDAAASDDRAARQSLE